MEGIPWYLRGESREIHECYTHFKPMNKQVEEFKRLRINAWIGVTTGQPWERQRGVHR